MGDPKPSLSDLRIDDQARHGGSVRTGIWLLAFLLVAASAAALWYWLGAPRAVPVRVATVVEASGAGRGGGPILLNASGYVTARRRATVSSKMTGKVAKCWSKRGWP